jgi:tyrosinase
VQAIASAYSGSASHIYKRAADSFRIPYWDWASVPQMPDVVNAENLTVTTPSGVRNVRNPLLQYRFQKYPFDKKYFPSSKDIARDWYLASYPRTVRNPDADGSSSNFAHANEVLKNANLKGQVVSSPLFGSMEAIVVAILLTPGGKVLCIDKISGLRRICH